MFMKTNTVLSLPSYVKMGETSEASASHLPMAMDGDAPQLSKAAALMQEIQTFGRLPTEVEGTSEAPTPDRNVAKRF